MIRPVKISPGRLFKILIHSLDFTVLVLILAGALYGLYYFRHQIAVQLAISILLGIVYILWGMAHHLHEGDWGPKILWEYLSMAALVVFILIVFLLRA